MTPGSNDVQILTALCSGGRPQTPVVAEDIEILPRVAGIRRPNYFTSFTFFP